MIRSSRTARMSGAVLLAFGGVGLGVAAANAAVVPGAVTAVRLEDTTADRWAQIRLQMDWRVPDGTQGGDTFTLQLPKELSATDGQRFALKDATGATVANAVIDGDQVTFTMTEYAETHVGVHGAAWFWVRFTSVVEPGDDVSVVFRVGSDVFTDQISVTDPGPASPRAASKWQSWMTDANGKRIDRFLWAITGPAVEESMVGSTYQIVDTPGEGQRVDCANVSVWSGSSPAWGDARWVAKDRWNIECTPDQVSVTIKPTVNEIGRAFRLLGQSEVTDTTLSEYRNSGFVRLWGTAELPVNQIVKAGAGGVGTGEVPSPTPTSPSPTGPAPTTTAPGSPTESPTSPAPTTTTTPGVPAPSETGVPVPVPTVTVTETVSPTPTTTVTPGTPAPTSPTTTSPTTTSPTGPGTVAPGQTVDPSPSDTTTPIGSDTTTPVGSGTTAAPGTTTTTTPVAGGTPISTVTVGGGTPVGTRPVVAGGTSVTTVSSGSPRRIDTGVPEQGVDMRLAGAGGALALVSGLGLLAVSRRRPEERDSTR